MIIVKIELHSAITGKMTEIGRLKIANDGTGSAQCGNYNVQKIGMHGRKLKKARVENHARRSYTVWRLLRKALEALKV